MPMTYSRDMSTYTEYMDDPDVAAYEAAADAREDYELDQWEEARELDRIEHESER